MEAGQSGFPPASRQMSELTKTEIPGFGADHPESDDYELEN